MRIPADVNVNYLVDDHMRFYFSESFKVFVSDNFQEIHSVGAIIAAVSNALITQLFCELGGRIPFGGGLLKIQTYEVEKLPVVNHSTFHPVHQNRLLLAFNRMAEREIKSVFEELGLPKPNRDLSNINPEDVSLDKVMPDRRELDKVIFEVLDLTESEQLEVYKAVVELVKSRLAKARSV